MDVDALRTFCEVARTKSFRRAARALQVTQSCVSRRLRSLEDEVGATLLDRSPHAVRLSTAGQSFLGFAERAVSTIREGCRTVALRQVRRELSVGATPTVSFTRLPAMLAALAREDPELTLRVRTGPPDELFELLLDQALDLALLTTHMPHPDLRYEVAYEEPLVAVAQPGLTPGRGGAVPVIRNMLERWSPWSDLWERIEASGRYRIVAEVEYVQVAERLAVLGLGVAFLPASVASNSLRSGALEPYPADIGPVTRPVYLVRPEAAVRGPAAQLGERLRAGFARMADPA